MNPQANEIPLMAFRFWVDFKEPSLFGGTPVDICGGAFAECTGLEATMEPMVIKEGGRNYGTVQRPGRVTFGTVVLKRGVTRNRTLWQRFYQFVNGAYSKRMEVTVTMFDAAGTATMAWVLADAQPVKFKAADFNAKSADIAIEELHLVHNGLRLESNPERSRL